MELSTAVALCECNVQGATGLTLAARLNQQALLPDMMFPTVNRFNPDNGQPLPTANGELPPCSNYMLHA